MPLCLTVFKVLGPTSASFITLPTLHHQTENPHGPTGALTITLGVPQDFEHLGVGGILAQGPHHVPTLTVQDLAIPRSVKQLEGLLEL